MNDRPSREAETVGVYLPIVDREFNIIAYEAAVKHVETGAEHGDFDLSGFQDNEVTNIWDYYYQYQAISSYKGTVPLLVRADGREACPEILPSATENNANIIFLLKKRNIDYDYLDLLQLNPSFALEENSEGVLAWPFSSNWTIPAFIKTFPSFIKLRSGDGDRPFIRSECIEGGDESFVDLILSPFKKLGVKFIVSGVNCKKDFELMKYAGDGFMGSWITEQVNGNKYEIQ